MSGLSDDKYQYYVLVARGEKPEDPIIHFRIGCGSQIWTLEPKPDMTAFEAFQLHSLLVFFEEKHSVCPNVYSEVANLIKRIEVHNLQRHFTVATKDV